MLCAVLCVCGATRVRQSGIRFGLMDWDGARFWLIGLCVVLWNGILPGALRGLSQSTHATWIDNNTKHTQNHFNKRDTQMHWWLVFGTLPGYLFSFWSMLIVYVVW